MVSQWNDTDSPDDSRTEPAAPSEAETAGRDRNARHPDGRLAEETSPDVFLDVPELSVDEIDLDVEDLRAHVSLHADVLDLLKLHVGADVALGRVALTISGVQAQAQLRVRLDRVAEIIDRVLTTIDRNPQIIEHVLRAAEPVLRGAGTAVGELGEGGRRAIEDVGRGAGGAVEDVGRGAGGAVEDVGRGAGGAVEDVGRGAGGAVEDVGRGAGGAVEDVGESARGVTDDLGTAAGRVVGGRRRRPRRISTKTSATSLGKPTRKPTRSRTSAHGRKEEPDVPGRRAAVANHTAASPQNAAGLGRDRLRELRPRRERRERRGPRRPRRLPRHRVHRARVRSTAAVARRSADDGVLRRLRGFSFALPQRSGRSPEDSAGPTHLP
ncbi:hypothetical protein SZMC14600_13314 [Saccharomonospora azurea SZMC 14600]|nr:hypothetical protein SZMC14600_13314 [Saccharomonospora azurea SZMC 14600]